MARRLLGLNPTIARREVIDGLGVSDKYRNPFRVELPDSFPKPGSLRRRGLIKQEPNAHRKWGYDNLPQQSDERLREHHRIFETQTEWSRKGKPF